MSREGIKGACESCLYDGLLGEAQARYDNQPSAHVAVAHENGNTTRIRRSMTDEQLSNMISSPQRLIEMAEAHLESNPCRFVTNGICEAAQFVIKKAANQRLA